MRLTTIRRILTTVAALFITLPHTVRAAETTLSWTPPITNTNGTPLTNLAGYRIYYGQGTLGQTIQVMNPAATSFVVNGLTPGTWSFEVTAYTAQAESARSNRVQRTFLEAPTVPNAPVVQAGALTVYTIVKRVDGFVLLPVGTVPAGTQCDPSQSVNGRYAVPRAVVTWTGSTRPDVVVANCT
jgi:hypothetical protein